MIIDFHTHVYPDKIAEKTVQMLSTNSGFPNYTNGKMVGLLESMEKANIDISVVLPVQTRVGQFDTINKSSIKMNEEHDNIISFGAIHPDEDDIEQKLMYLKSNGIKGIKIHPDYQYVFIDDERYINIISKCYDLGLAVVTHGGKDPSFDILRCDAERGAKLLDAVEKHIGDKSKDYEPFIVFAHMGEYNNEENIYKYLIGRNCYLDISNATVALSNEQITKIIKAHGADKILFASDSPWQEQSEYVKLVYSLNLTDEEKDMILYKNAKKLLKI